MGIPTDSGLWKVVRRHCEQLRSKVETRLKELRLDYVLDWARLSDLIHTDAFDCHYTSVAAGQDLNRAGFTCTWQRGDVAYRGQSVFSIRSTAHEWLVVPGTEGENTILEFTIGYHLCARRHLSLDALGQQFNPLWVVQHDDLSYTVHYAHYWDARQDRWGNQNKVEPAVQLWESPRST